MLQIYLGFACFVIDSITVTYDHRMNLRIYKPPFFVII